jgi:ribonuclease P protein component
VLPPAARLTRSTDFELVVRRGRRAGRTRLVVHTHPAGPDATTRAGFIVGRNVGAAVVRHRVQRRLRHLLRERMDSLAPGTLIVVRALAPAAGASSAELATDLDSALRKLHLIASAA